MDIENMEKHFDWYISTVRAIVSCLCTEEILLK